MGPSEKPEDLKAVKLNRELMSNTIVNEVERVMLSSPSLDKAIQSFFLGITEITGIEKIALFKIDKQLFQLKAHRSSGLEKNELKKLNLSLDFMSGEYPDAIFLNKHIVVDPVETEDPFKRLGTRSYVVMPIVSRITTKCWQVRNCEKKECPCYEGPDPYCWSVSGAALDTGAETEDERRMVCVNCSQFKCEAVLWLDTTGLPHPIRGEDIGHITALNRHMGMVIESFNMYDKLARANQSLEENNHTLKCLNHELKEKDQKIQVELDHAKSIQKGLLPVTFGAGFHRDIAARYIPAGKVGGDYYDCFAINDDLLGILMADVSGHGIAAALIMSMFKVLLKSFSPTLREPREILQRINDTFLNETNSSNFITVFYAIFNRKTREITYCNAGHNPQLLMQGDGPIQELKSEGTFIGILEDITIEQQVVPLNGNSRLLLFTDGITETKNKANTMFGLENIRGIAEQTRGASCGETVDILMKSLDAFREGTEIKDDVTALVIDL